MTAAKKIPKLSALGQAARAWAQKGYRVWPITPGTNGAPVDNIKWKTESTTDPNIIEKWWEKHPDANIGIVLDGVVVVDLDIDKKKGVDGLEDMVRHEHDHSWPLTFTVRTPSGGMHWYYRLPKGFKARNRALGKLEGFPGIEAKVTHITAPPSVRADGVYSVKARRKYADAPPWLLEHIKRPEYLKRKRPMRKAPSRSGAYGRASLEKELGKLRAEYAPGARDRVVNEVSFSLGQLVAGRELAYESTELELFQACQEMGFDGSFTPSDCQRKIRHGLNDGMKTPRSAPAPASKPQRRRQGPSGPKSVLPDDGATGEFTDLWGAERLLEAHGDDLLYAFGLDWLHWDGSRFSPDKKGTACQFVRDVARRKLKEAQDGLQRVQAGSQRAQFLDNQRKWAKKTQSTSGENNVLSMAQSEPQVATVPEELDVNPMLINCLNGTFDLQTGKLEPHRRSDKITKVCPCKYSYDNAETPTWNEFLHRIFDGDEELISSLQRLLGYAITGHVIEEKLIIFHGSGANGKSTLLNAISHVLADYYRQVDTGVVMPGKNGGNETMVMSEKAQLKGARIAVSAETSGVRILDDSRIKQLCSNDLITAKKYHRDTFQFRPTHQLILMTNHEPIIKTTDEGTWRRVLFVPFNVTIPENEQDPFLSAKLQDEAPGILKWLIDGCLQWQQVGLKPCDKITRATSDYRASQDELAPFIEDHCDVGAELKSGVTSLYNRYKKWAEDSGMRPKTSTGFGRALTDRGFQKERIQTSGKREVVYFGLSLRPM